MDWFKPVEAVIVDSQIESIMSLVFAYFAWIGQTPGYTDIDVLYAEWHKRGNL
jgi:hypothetical protein